MLADAQGSAKVTASDTLLSGAVFDIAEHEFEFGGERIRRQLVEHPGAVGVIALNDADEVLLVHQYRHPVAGTLWELPAGLLDIAGEDPLAAAKRELAEETDVVAETWQLLLDLTTSPGGSTEVIRIYQATGISDAPEAFAREDEEAAMEKRWVPFDEVVEAVLDVRLHNAALVAAVLAVDAARRRGSTPHRPNVPFDWHRPKR